MSPKTNTVVELRQYTLKPGRHDELIALFEREFVETQEAEGIELIGTFRDADDPDRFVWLRGFPDMECRAKSLAAFYGGPVWKAHRNAANDTMIDSDNVLLLRPAWSGAGFKTYERAEKGMVFANIHHFDAPIGEDVITVFRDHAANALAACVTEPAENTFPALPVRAGENVFVTFAHAAVSAPSSLARQIQKSETLRLIPTAQSRL
ncbi:MAG TPA: NIPSNAP family protein [Rhizomicrobium sp.]